LRREGCRVHVPAAQGCCGALHLHAGLREAARPLVAANLAAFPRHLDAVVVNAAGCGSSMKEYRHWHAEAAAFSAKVRDLSEFLVQLGTTARYAPLVRKVAYDDACHLCHGQRIRMEPRQLLRAIPGLTLAPVARPEDCCGSAGIYNLLEPELADRILERKIDDLVASGADVVVTGNPGCMLQIALGLRRRRSPMQVVHTAEVLAASIGATR
jgi:glycolate oxidase iron-sulfur subunit